jgi:hypothetical protein
LLCLLWCSVLQVLLQLSQYQTLNFLDRWKAATCCLLHHLAPMLPLRLATMRPHRLAPTILAAQKSWMMTSWAAALAPMGEEALNCCLVNAVLL